jgi:hypothetical protein
LERKRASQSSIESDDFFSERFKYFPKYYIELKKEVKMEKIQVLIIALLIVAIVFSVVSMAMNFSLANLKPVKTPAPTNLQAGNPNGQVSLVVNPPIGVQK